METQTAAPETRSSGRIRLRGLAFVGSGIGLFIVGLIIAAQWRSAPPGLLLVTVFLGLGLVPKGALELLTGKQWIDNPQWVRVVALVVGIPGFLAILGYSLYFIFNR